MANRPQLRLDWNNLAASIAHNVGDFATEFIRNEAPVAVGKPGAGRLKNSIKHVALMKTGVLELQFWSYEVDYTKWVIRGTHPHVILPKTAKILAWKGADGLMHFAKRVNHPGTAPNPFAQRGMSKAQDGIRAAIQAAFKGQVRLINA